MGIVFFAGTTVGSQFYALLYRLVIVTASDAIEKFVSYSVTVGFAFGILLLSCGFAYAQFIALGSQAYVFTLLPDMHATGHITAGDLAVACNDLSHPNDITTSFALLATLAGLSEAMCVAVAAATFCRLRSVALFSERTRKMHAELTRLLVIQVRPKVLTKTMMLFL